MKSLDKLVLGLALGIGAVVLYVTWYLVSRLHMAGNVVAVEAAAAEAEAEAQAQESDMELPRLEEVSSRGE